MRPGLREGIVPAVRHKLIKNGLVGGEAMVGIIGEAFVAAKSLPSCRKEDFSRKRRRAHQQSMYRGQLFEFWTSIGCKRLGSRPFPKPSDSGGVYQA